METSQEACSVVTDTTRDSDETSQELPTLWRGLYGYPSTMSNGKCTPVQRNPPTDTENGESPLFPVQQLTKIHFSGNNNNNSNNNINNNNNIGKAAMDGVCTQDSAMQEDDGISEFSQPLIPLRKPGETTVPSFRKKTIEQIKEDTIVEESQSLLPQTAAERSQLPYFKGTRPGGAIPNPLSVYNKPVKNKQKHVNDFKKCKDANATQDEMIPETQSSTSSKGDNQLWASQQTEISQSQGSASATDAVMARLERLVESLGTATRKQKRVMEIAVNQCVSKLQDNVNRRLKSKTVSSELQETIKKILKTTQSCLSKLLAHHKKEQCLLTESRRAVISQQRGQKKLEGDSDTVHQSTLVELRQRQRELQGLLKRQQNLLDRFKEIMRSQPGIKESNSHYRQSSIQNEEKALKSKKKATGRPKTLCIETPDTNNLPEGGSTTYEICPTDLSSQMILPNQHENFQDSDQVQASSNSQSTGNPESSGHLKSRGNLPASGNIPSSGNLPSSGSLPPSGNLKSGVHFPSSGILPSSGQLPSSESLQASCNLPSSKCNLIDQNLHLDENCTADVINSKSIEATEPKQGHENIPVIDDCGGNNMELVDNTSEPSQSLTTVPDTQESYSQATDNTCSQPVNADDNLVNLDGQKTQDGQEIVVDSDKLNDQAHTVEEIEQPVSKRIPKRNLPWSQDQGPSQTTKSQKAEKTAKESPKQQSEMLWLNMLHQNKNKDTGAKSASGKIAEKRDDKILENHKGQPKSTDDMQNRIIDDAQALVGDERLSDKVQQNLFSETRHTCIDELEGTESDINFDANASKFMSNSKPLNAQTIRDTIPLVSAQDESLQPRESFLKPAAIGFISPPRIHMEADISSDVSPTATSMSSDVFLVKAKELNRRMKMRERLAAEQALINDGKTTLANTQKTDNTQQNVHRTDKTAIVVETNNIQQQTVNRSAITPANIEQTISTQQQVVFNNSKTQPTIFVIRSQQPNIPLRKEVRLEEANGRDTISEAIDSVIAKSRNVTDISKNAEHKVSLGPGEKLVYSSILPRQVIENVSSLAGANSTGKQDNAKETIDLTKTTVEMTSKSAGFNGLPSIKQLLQAGVITAGKLCLSVHAQGTLHKASLTPLGKIRTQQGMVFPSPMQWLSTLTDGETKKKRSTYHQVLYKGRSLLDICTRHQSNTGTCQPTISHVDPAPPSSGPDYRPHGPHQSNQNLNCFPARKSEKAVQVEMEVCPKTSQGNEAQKHKMSEAELWLNKLLSTSVVRLLTERDLVPCDDLPDNFWTEDYSKVRLGVEIWDTVDKW